MRKIYESSALHRDDADPFAPSEDDADRRPEAMRTVPSGGLSRLLVPYWIRYRALSVSVSTPRREYTVGESIPFRVEFRNALPVPITVPTISPRLWYWHVDGVREASEVDDYDPPDERRGFAFDRGERKRFRRNWAGYVRVSDDEWEPIDPGEHTIGARLNVEDAERRGLTAETTVRIVPE